MNGAYVKKSHEWIAPPPGQGRERMCKHCGARISAGKDTECGGVDAPDAVQPTEAEYDAYAHI